MPEFLNLSCMSQKSKELLQTELTQGLGLNWPRVGPKHSLVFVSQLASHLH